MVVPYARQLISKSDLTAVTKVLKSNFLTTGPKVELFENKLRKKFSSKYVSVVNSATSALHLACLSLGLTKKDILWTTPISFVASSNCAIYCGAKVDFVDINDKTFNICEKKLEQKLKNTSKNKLPKVVVVVHLSGHPVNLKKIKKLSNRYGFKIIEDASHAAGSKYHDSQIGDCKYSNVCIFSFHPIKIITTGEGGSVLTNYKKIHDKVSVLRSHGIYKNIKSKTNPWFYDQKNLGYNYRMNEIEATLGVSQLLKLDKFVRERNKIANLYKLKLDRKKVQMQHLDIKSKSSMHLFIIRVNSSKRKLLYEGLKKNGINTNLHYIPIYRHSFYKKYNIKYNNFKNSEQYYKEAISIPIYCGLKKNTQMKIIRIINKIL